MAYFTKVIFGRARTTAEQTQEANFFQGVGIEYNQILLNAQIVPSPAGDYADNVIRVWAKETDCDSYLALLNGFTPPPGQSLKLVSPFVPPTP